MGNWLQVPGECAERLSASVAPEHLRGSCQPGSIRCGAPPVVLPRLRRSDVASTTPPATRLGRSIAPNLRLHVATEVQFVGRKCRIYLESASDSAAPEHLPGACGRTR